MFQTDLESDWGGQSEVLPACLEVLSRQYVWEQSQELRISSVVSAAEPAVVAAAVAAVVAVLCVSASFPLQAEKTFLELMVFIPLKIIFQTRTL
jgi:hypothetical protein